MSDTATQQTDSEQPDSSNETPYIDASNLAVVGFEDRDRDELLETLEEHLPEDVFEELNVNPDYQHPDWGKGEPCPECGEAKVSDLSAGDEVYLSKDGHYEYCKQGEAHGETSSILCMNCLTVLKRITNPSLF